MQGIGRKPDAAGDEKERDGKQAAEDGAPGGPLGVAADEKPLGVGGCQGLPQHHGQEQGDESRRGGAVERIEIGGGQRFQHRARPPRLEQGQDQQHRHAACEQYKL